MQGMEQKRKAKILSSEGTRGRRNLFLRIAGCALEILSCFAHSFRSSCCSCIYNEAMKNVKALKAENRYKRNLYRRFAGFCRLALDNERTWTLFFIKIPNQFNFAESELNCGFCFGIVRPSWNNHKVLWAQKRGGGTSLQVMAVEQAMSSVWSFSKSLLIVCDGKSITKAFERGRRNIIAVMTDKPHQYFYHLQVL